MQKKNRISEIVSFLFLICYIIDLILSLKCFTCNSRLIKSTGWEKRCKNLRILFHKIDWILKSQSREQLKKAEKCEGNIPKLTSDWLGITGSIQITFAADFYVHSLFLSICSMSSIYSQPEVPLIGL